jgi:hypothetical protein
MIKIIITLVILFLVNNFLVRENFSNSYQDATLTQKLDISGTNISKDKVLLTLYYDRREINCKYFYDYFSTNKGGENFSDLRYADLVQLTGKNQAWNSIKNLYAEGSHHFIHPNFMNIEEIEVNQYDLNNFNNVSAHKIYSQGNVVGNVELLGGKPRDYQQFFRRNDFLKKIPFVTLTMMKHKDESEIVDIIENNRKNTNNGGTPRTETDNEVYNRLNNMDKYNIITVNYEGIYSPNNRAIQATVDNIKKFVEDSCDEYLKVESETNHQNRIGVGETPSFLGTTHSLSTSISSTPTQLITKCNKCSEFKYI